MLEYNLKKKIVINKMSNYFDCSKITPGLYSVYLRELNYFKKPESIFKEGLWDIIDTFFTESTFRNGLNKKGNLITSGWRKEFSEFHKSLFLPGEKLSNNDPWTNDLEIIFIGHVNKLIEDLEQCPLRETLEDNYKKWLKHEIDMSGLSPHRGQSYAQDINNIALIIREARNLLELSYPEKVIDNDFLLKFIVLFSDWKAMGGPFKEDDPVRIEETYENLMRKYFDGDWTRSKILPSSNKPKTYYFY